MKDSEKGGVIICCGIIFLVICLLINTEATVGFISILVIGSIFYVGIRELRKRKLKGILYKKYKKVRGSRKIFKCKICKSEIKGKQNFLKHMERHKEEKRKHEEKKKELEMMEEKIKEWEKKGYDVSKLKGKLKKVKKHGKY